ncbi:hypothetical protein [Schumannella sp. 10F1B-5-1]|uniref:hypothetical protein n=1 Tax=Schumannella sp. 10F1B-5-1 TaxID=2590780 RepID=UPI0011318F49|nr:hypothetical protein [Schumannella sp. 10F1B-5-1]TPW71799.1 hypothetical protein FJ658_10720 [Schumannella sp. 10F1B-5-1]
MSYTEFTLAGDHQHAMNVVGSTIVGLGFRAQIQPDGEHRFSRGDLQSSVMVGGIAGSRFYVEFDVLFGTDAAGNLTARIQRGSRSLFKGGRLGVGQADDAFEQIVNAVGAATTQAGIYLGATAE